eukprot:g4028.t1
MIRGASLPPDALPSTSPITDSPTVLLSNAYGTSLVVFNTKSDNLERLEYSFSSASWATYKEADMVINTLGSSFAVLGGDRILIAGGGDPTSPISKATSSLLEYQLGVDTLTKLTPMPAPRVYAASVGYQSNLFFVLGGYTDDAQVTNAVTRYDYQHGVWDSLPSMQYARWGLGASYINGSIYAIGGHDLHGDYLNVNEKYDLSTGKWSVGAPMPTPRSFFAQTVFNCRIYVLGGVSDNEHSKDMAVVEVFYPAYNKWVTLAQALHNPVSHVSAVGLPTNLFGADTWLLVVGGNYENQGTTKIQAVSGVLERKYLWDTTQCSAGYFGVECNSHCPTAPTSCDGGCGGGGYCDTTTSGSSGKCICRSHFQGVDCSNCKFPRVDPSNPKDSIEKCSSCAMGYYGTNCDACPSSSQTLSASTICNGHGLCDGSGTSSGTGKCLCQDGWNATVNCSSCSPGYWALSDTACQKCDCYAPEDILKTECKMYVCSGGRGTCAADHAHCWCNVGWGGDSCEVPGILFGGISIGWFVAMFLGLILVTLGIVHFYGGRCSLRYWYDPHYREDRFSFSSQKTPIFSKTRASPPTDIPSPSRQADFLRRFLPNNDETRKSYGSMQW